MTNKLSNHLDQVLCGQLTEKQKALLLKDSVYFGEAYPLKAELKTRDLLETYKLELNPVRFHENWIKMYSVGSSSRLCYLRFRNDPQVQFEYQLGICEKVYAHYDAFDPKNHIYYECKYHEIAANHRKNLKEWAYRPFLEKLGITVNQVSDGFLIPIFTEFGIYDFGDEKDIYSIHFDFKQLITHISGMINQNINGKLNYIFFTPDIAYNGTDKIIDKLYSELKTEVAAIEKSGFARKLKEYGIELAFDYCPVSKFVIELV